MLWSVLLHRRGAGSRLCHLQGSHTHDIPEVLLLDEVLAAQVPRLRVGVPDIIGNGESP